MADILIRGMAMPKSGEIFCINIFPDGKVTRQLDLSCEQIATAVPLPEGHGRLTAEWISVKERLPEQNQRVLVCGVRGGVQICRYWENRDYGGGLQFMFFTNKHRSITVTHWMPLPEPPEMFDAIKEKSKL